jgi:hypothetical protein
MHSGLRGLFPLDLHHGDVCAYRRWLKRPSVGHVIVCWLVTLPPIPSAKPTVLEAV